jgi:hypothetical protein
MTGRALKVGDVYRLTESARADLGEDRDRNYDEVRICAEVYLGDGIEPDWCVAPADGTFGPVYQTSAQGLRDTCEFVREGPKPRHAFGLELA